jgi:hypothetical protein
MTQPEYRLDMDMMYAVHDALRRDVVQVTRVAEAADASPASRLTALRGWELFRKFLEVHHASEDAGLWPALRARAAGNDDQLALITALEDEHSVIDPLLAAAAAAAEDAAAPGSDGAKRLAGAIDELTTAVTAHLVHEEGEGLNLIDALLTPEEWAQFAAVHRERIGDDRVSYMPWLLEQATNRTVAHINGQFPEQLLAAYRAHWAPAYAALNRWEAPAPQ